MKTNKERSKIILSKYSDLANNPNKNQNTNSAVEEKEGKKKFHFGKKFWISTCSALVLVLGLTFGLVFGLKDDFDLDGMYIVNFENYTAIGSGVEEESEVSSAGMFSAASTDSLDLKLVGLTRDGMVEELKVSKKKNGKAQEIEWSLSAISSFKNFTIVGFSNFPSNRIDTDQFLIVKGYRTAVVIDHNTGKMYSLDDLLTEDDSELTIQLFTPETSGTTPREAKEAFESDDAIYFFAEEDFNDEGPYGEKISQKFYKASIEGDELKVEELFDISQDAGTMVNVKSVCVDKYGNVFLVDDPLYYNSSLYSTYIVTSEGKIRSLNKNVFMSINGIMYTEDGQSQFDEKGNEVENTFAGFKFFVSEERLLRRDGNVEYYYNAENNYHYRDDAKDRIYKVTWSSEVEFEVEEIMIEDYEDIFVTTRNKIYFMNETEQTLYSIDIETGAKEDVYSDYYFTSIATDNLGNVVFTGVGEDNQTVTGIIDSDGRIEVGVSASKYKVYYIKPLN